MGSYFPQMKMQLEKNYILVNLEVPLNAAHTKELLDVFNYIINHADRPVRLDLSATQQMDSSGMGALTYLFKRLVLIDSSVDLIGVNEQTKAFLQKLQVDKIISINQNK